MPNLSISGMNFLVYDQISSGAGFRSSLQPSWSHWTLFCGGGVVWEHALCVGACVCARELWPGKLCVVYVCIYAYIHTYMHVYMQACMWGNCSQVNLVLPGFAQKSLLHSAIFWGTKSGKCRCTSQTCSHQKLTHNTYLLVGLHGKGKDEVLTYVMRCLQCDVCVCVCVCVFVCFCVCLQYPVPEWLLFLDHCGEWV